jgi:hypothetical protein
VLRPDNRERPWLVASMLASDSMREWWAFVASGSDGLLNASTVILLASAGSAAHDPSCRMKGDVAGSAISPSHLGSWRQAAGTCSELMQCSRLMVLVALWCFTLLSNAPQLTDAYHWHQQRLAGFSSILWQF